MFFCFTFRPGLKNAWQWDVKTSSSGWEKATAHQWSHLLVISCTVEYNWTNCLEEEEHEHDRDMYREEQEPSSAVIMNLYFKLNIKSVFWIIVDWMGFCGAHLCNRSKVCEWIIMTLTYFWRHVFIYLESHLSLCKFQPYAVSSNKVLCNKLWWTWCLVE